MVFGRCFENALVAYFRGEDCTAALFKEWTAHRDASFQYRKGESWDRMLHQGVHLLHRFAQDDRIKIPHPAENTQIKLTKTLPNGNEFVSYIDAIGKLEAALPDRLEDNHQPLQRSSIWLALA